MFRLSYTKESEIKGHIKFKKDPMWFGCGNYEDEDGILWDVYGIFGRDFVQARKVDNNGYYSTTSYISSYNVTWEPYSYEVIEKKI